MLRALSLYVFTKECRSAVVDSSAPRLRTHFREPQSLSTSTSDSGDRRQAVRKATSKIAILCAGDHVDVAQILTTWV